MTVTVTLNVTFDTVTITDTVTCVKHFHNFFEIARYNSEICRKADGRIVTIVPETADVKKQPYNEFLEIKITPGAGTGILRPRQQ